jgi:hypothetical protein
VQRVEAIISNFTTLAKNEMSQGLTAVSAGFVNRRNAALNADRHQRYQRQLTHDRQKQIAENEQVQALVNFSN